MVHQDRLQKAAVTVRFSRPVSTQATFSIEAIQGRRNNRVTLIIQFWKFWKKHKAVTDIMKLKVLKYGACFGAMDHLH